MNCKQGDLAIVVHSDANNHGKIVRCVKFVHDQLYVNGSSGPSWEIEPRLPSLQGPLASHIRDAYLRPLPPLDDSDDVVETEELEHHD